MHGLCTRGAAVTTLFEAPSLPSPQKKRWYLWAKSNKDLHPASLKVIAFIILVFLFFFFFFWGVGGGGSECLTRLFCCNTETQIHVYFSSRLSKLCVPTKLRNCQQQMGETFIRPGEKKPQKNHDVRNIQVQCQK